MSVNVHVVMLSDAFFSRMMAALERVSGWCVSLVIKMTLTRVSVPVSAWIRGLYISDDDDEDDTNSMFSIVSDSCDTVLSTNSGMGTFSSGIFWVFELKRDEKEGEEEEDEEEDDDDDDDVTAETDFRAISDVSLSIRYALNLSNTIW